MSQPAPTWDQMYRTNSGSEIVMDDEVVVPSVEQPVPIPESEQIRIFARNYVFDGLKLMNLFEYLTRPQNNDIYAKIELDTERAILEFLQKLQPLQPISEVQNLQPFKTEIAQKFYNIVKDEIKRSKIQSPFEDYEQFQARILRNLRENPITYEIPDRRYQPLRKCKVNYESDRVYGFSSGRYSQYRKWMKKKIPPKNFRDYAILGYAKDPQFFTTGYPYAFLYESDYIIVPHTAPKWKQIINFTDYNSGGFTVVGGMATEELRANFFGGRPMIGCITMLGFLDTDYMHAISYCLVPPQVDVHGVKQMGNLYVFTTYKITDRGYGSNNTWINALARKVEQLVGENIRAWELYSQTLQKDLGTCASWALTFLYTLCRNPFGVYPIANKLRDAKGGDFWEAIYVPLQKWRTEHPDEATNPGPFDLLRGSGIHRNVFKFIQDEIKDGGLILSGEGKVDVAEGTELNHYNDTPVMTLQDKQIYMSPTPVTRPEYGRYRHDYTVKQPIKLFEFRFDWSKNTDNQEDWNEFLDMVENYYNKLPDDRKYDFQISAVEILNSINVGRASVWTMDFDNALEIPFLEYIRRRGPREWEFENSRAALDDKFIRTFYRVLWSEGQYEGIIREKVRGKKEYVLAKPTEILEEKSDRR